MGNLAVSDLAPCGVILAGGAGRRMGGQGKAQVFLKDTPLIQHVIARLAPQVDRIALSVSVSDPWPNVGLPLIRDDFSGRMGPLAGVLAAMMWAAGQGLDHVVVVPVDGPFVPLDLTARLGTGEQPRLARAGGRDHPTFGSWPAALAGDLRAFLSSGAKPRLTDFAARAGAVWIEFPDASAFENINTPEDLSRAELRS